MPIFNHLKDQLAGIDVVQNVVPVFTVTDASNAIYDLLKSVFNDGDFLFPVSTVEKRQYPDAVYSISAGPLQKKYKNTVIAYTTLYDVVIRAKENDQLMALVSQVEAIVSAASGYQLVDSANGYAEKENAYVMALSIEVSRPVSSDMSVVADKSVIIAEALWRAEKSRVDNCLRQRREWIVPLVLTAKTAVGLEALRKSVMQVLHGWRDDQKKSRVQLLQGDVLQSDGGLFSAVDIYTYDDWVIAE